MSKPTSNESYPVWDYEKLQNVFANHLCTTERQLQGKLLTFIDSLEFNDKRNKAAKDIIKQTIREVLSSIAINMNESFNEIEKGGYIGKDPSTENSLSSSIKHYWHWYDNGLEGELRPGIED